MEGKGSSWFAQGGGGGGGGSVTTAGRNNKVGEGFGRAKSAASTGVKKVKQGTSSSLRWIKAICHKKH
ncbi:hypothetical protein Acr_00g0019140 [Actinidia rufa]|uniref:Uncharacterized protein n=1 Tax=Actinidia rufa TaxID=165716 RepID=A0A7J0DBN4_9ERIC|nr:hypothetical protein Acr_00g0019140 [Actinidia rufa]